VLCAIQLRKGGTKAPNGREYARFDVNREVKRAKVALWAMRSGRVMRIYVIPLTPVASVYLPVEGKYAVGNSHKPRQRLDPLRESVAPARQRQGKDYLRLVPTPGSPMMIDDDSL